MLALRIFYFLYFSLDFCKSFVFLFSSFLVIILLYDFGLTGHAELQGYVPGLPLLSCYVFVVYYLLFSILAVLVVLFSGFNLWARVAFTWGRHVPRVAVSLPLSPGLPVILLLLTSIVFNFFFILLP
jgi:hypothetical protein